MQQHTEQVRIRRMINRLTLYLCRCSQCGVCKLVLNRPKLKIGVHKGERWLAERLVACGALGNSHLETDDRRRYGKSRLKHAAAGTVNMNASLTLFIIPCSYQVSSTGETICGLGAYNIMVPSSN